MKRPTLSLFILMCLRVGGFAVCKAVVLKRFDFKDPQYLCAKPRSPISLESIHNGPVTVRLV